MSNKDKRLQNDPLNWVGQQEEETKPVGRPRTLNHDIEKSSQEGLQDSWTRYTVIVREDRLKKLKDYAYTDRRSIKEVVNEMIDEYLKDKDIIERPGKDE